MYFEVTRFRLLTISYRWKVKADTRLGAVTLATILVTTEASAQTFECDGHITNGYDANSPGFRTFEARTIEITLDCDWLVRYVGYGNCYYRIDGRWGFQEGYLYSNGDFHLDWDSRPFGRLAHGIPKRLSFKISEQPVGVSPNEGQRWFHAYC